MLDAIPSTKQLKLNMCFLFCPEIVHIQWETQWFRLMCSHYRYVWYTVEIIASENFWKSPWRKKNCLFVRDFVFRSSQKLKSFSNIIWKMKRRKLSSFGRVIKFSRNSISALSAGFCRVPKIHLLSLHNADYRISIMHQNHIYKYL